MNIACKLAGFTKIPSDSEIYVEGENVKKVLFGIDIDSSDLYYAKQQGYDAVIVHHPAGSIINAYKVFNDQVGIMVKKGVPVDRAKDAIREKLEILRISSVSKNYDETVSVAKMLNLPFLNIHQPLDEIGRNVMQVKVDELCKNKDTTLGDLVNGLGDFKEMKNARTKVEALIGDLNKPAGNTLVAHGAYTNGGYDVANACFENGVNTIIYIHIAYSDYIKLKSENKGNLIITGHMASDSLGINPFINNLEENGIQVTKIKGII